MHLFGIRVFEQQDDDHAADERKIGQCSCERLAAAVLTLAAGVPPGLAQQTAHAAPRAKTRPILPPAPVRH